MTIAWGDVEIHAITYDDGTGDVVAGSEFELLAPEGVLSGVIGKALIEDYTAEAYQDIMDHEGFGVVLGFAKDQIITLSAIDPTEPPTLMPYSEYILNEYRMFLQRRANARS
jgi:hypothetical protein